MICLICNENLSLHINRECFNAILDNLKLHYDHMNSLLEQRNHEIRLLQKHNKEMEELIRISEENQPQPKRIKKDQLYISKQRDSNINQTVSDDNDDDEIVTTSKLNMALNSEQLFNTSDLSPVSNNFHKTSSELITSPCKRFTPKRTSEDVLRSLNDTNAKVLKSCRSLWTEKTKPKTTSTRSWASNFLQANVPLIKKDEITEKPTKKVCLSLKKPTSTKMKQTLIDNYGRNAVGSESTFCEDFIEASPIMGKSTIKSAKSCLLQRNVNNNSNDGLTTIDRIVFDFSPTKKTDVRVADELVQSKVSNSINTRAITTRNTLRDSGTPSPSSKDNSSVIMLTPTTQDIIFIDDTNDEDSLNMNTMDLITDLIRDDKSSLKNFYNFENKYIQNYKRAKNSNDLKVNNDIQLPKPGGFIKIEKVSQNNADDFTAEQNFKDPRNDQLHNNDENEKAKYNDDNEEDDEDDSMPRPIQIKEEKEHGKGTFGKIDIKEKYNIDCQECETYVQCFGDWLTIDEVEEHLNKCVLHNRQQLNRTPEGFWNPLILSFPSDDERNQILVDSRLKNKKTAL